MTAMRKRTVPRPKHLFFNRDESWLRFNKRVLEEAQDETNPLLERLRFLAITASNLDEFVEVRVAGILQRIEDGFHEPPDEADDGLTESERLESLADQMHHFIREQYSCWTRQILPALAAQQVHILRWSQLSAEARAHAQRFYRDEVDPLLTPVTIDPSHPFPRVLNKALCIALLLRRKTGRTQKASPVLGVVTVPRTLPRIIRIPSEKGTFDFLFLHELIESQAEQLFRGYDVLSRSAFRVTRNSNLYMQEEEARSLLESVREELHNRRKGDAVRLEVEIGADEEMLDQLRVNFELDRWQVVRTDGPVNLTRISDLHSQIDRPDLKFPSFLPREYKLSRDVTCIFDELRERDVLLHHPFDSYSTVEAFIKSAASDTAVISMKQTLYRTSADSPIFQSMLEAATMKDVTVVVELMARFDEASNIRWARSLEDAGVQVFHGIVGQKTHCKLALLVRRDPDGITRRYAHLGTGNYNPVTARFYTDISLLTSRPELTTAVQHVFNYLTAEGDLEDARPLMVAPVTLAEDILRLIERETAHAKAGRKAHIIAKMNALLDRKTIEAMYDASAAGVEIDLIVRGMCSLRPQVPGLSERIRVRSIVGRFLEHSRIFWFANGGDYQVYCGSADWMPRNLYDRCEALFPVEAKAEKHRLREEILESYLRDNTKARLLRADGDYVRVARGAVLFDAQDVLMQIAERRSKPEEPAPTLASMTTALPKKKVLAARKSPARKA